ncbi:hypothetical protein CBS101457_006224 [Exobasidium rhododendri]|nr:hypothetical protein CBS101457_006224 [Exobasidium rhododendri]
MVTLLSERFRRAVLSDDLNAAKAIAERAAAETHNDAYPFDIRNETVLRSGNHPFRSSSLSVVKSKKTSGSANNSNNESTSNGSAGNGSSSSSSSSSSTSLLHINAAEILPSLSATQYQLVRHNRVREKNREADRCKSSLTLAIENGNSIEMIQWLLDEGHERGNFSRDVRNCTMISIAAQHDRVDVIDALCVDAVEQVADLHHRRSITFIERLRRRSADQEEDEEVEEGKSDMRIVMKDRDMNKGMRREEDNGTNERSYPGEVSPKRYFPSTGMTFEKGRVSFESDTTRSPFHRESQQDSAHDGKMEEEDEVASEIGRLLDAPDELGRTALSLASMQGHKEVVDKLLELGAGIDLADNEGNTPLHHAASYDHLLVVQVLIEKGCNFAWQNMAGFTAADYAYSLSLKGALEAFARTKYERDRGSIVPINSHEERLPKPIQKIKNTIIASTHKPLFSSTQYKLATHLRDLDF